MPNNGKITRNGAEIQIDENGNVVARPATGQDFIVEDDAVVGSLEAEELFTEKSATTVFLDSSQEIPDDTFVTVEFDETVIDQLDAFDSGNHTITIPESGTYAVSAQVLVNDDVSNQFQVNVKSNGSDIAANDGRDGFAERKTLPVATTYEEFDSGDDIDVEVRSRNDGEDTDLGFTRRFTYLSVRRV